jgi:Acetyltransferases
MTTRILDPADLALLLDTAPGLFDQPVDPEQAQAFLADPMHRIAAVIEQGAVLAFASGTILLHPDKPPSFFVNEVGTRDEARRRGHASAALAALIAEARRMGCQGIWLGTEADNTAARALYRRLGAEEMPFIGYGWDGAFDLD